MSEIRHFKDRGELSDYLVEKFIKDNGTVLLRGSMRENEVEDFSDFDLEIYMGEERKPYYEIAFVEGKIAVISIWFGLYKEGESGVVPEYIKVLHGEYMPYMGYIGDEGSYEGKDEVRRECQSVVDWLFKYMRNGDEECLLHVQKRINDR